MATVLLIDGQNFLEKIKTILKNKGITKEKEEPDWSNYDFIGLVDKVLQELEIGDKIFYLARLTEHPKTREKSKELIERLRLLKTTLERQGFKIVMAGRVRGHVQKDNKGKEFMSFREKGVDVRIAVDMITMSLLDKKVETIILGSSDSDLQPAINEIRNRGGVSIIYLGFEDNPNKGLTYTTHRTILIRNSEVLAFYQKQLKI